MSDSTPGPQIPQAYSSSTRGRNVGDYADRHFTGHLQLASGQEITLAIVADGFGERGLAASIAQLAIDTVLEYLRRVKLTNLPEMLESAFQTANKRVGEVVRRQNNLPLSTTLAAAAIHNNRLHIANVGNSRVYLVRGGRMLLLTVDHTVAYEMITSGLMNTDQALRQPNAQQLSRSIGFDPATVKVDLGLYLQGGGEAPEQARQQQGLELQPDDLVLVCSDGLVKPVQTNAINKGPLAGRDEIRKILESNSAQAAAQSLATLAAQRLSPDDVTTVILEMPGRALPRPAARPAGTPASPVKTLVSGTAARSPARRRNLLWISLIILFAFAILATLIVATVFGFSFLKGEKATATIAPSATRSNASPTPENVQFPPTGSPSATLTQTPTTTFTNTSQPFAPTATRTRQLQLPTATATPTFRLPRDTPKATPRNSPTPQPTETDWFPTLPPFPTFPPLITP